MAWLRAACALTSQDDAKIVSRLFMGDGSGAVRRLGALSTNTAFSLSTLSTTGERSVENHNTTIQTQLHIQGHCLAQTSPSLYVTLAWYLIEGL
jgi:hypothetical protein